MQKLPPILCTEMNKTNNIVNEQISANHNLAPWDAENMPTIMNQGEVILCYKSVR